MLEALTSIDLDASTRAQGRFDRILVVIDGPSGSQPAFSHAIDLALVAHGTLVCAVPSPKAAASVSESGPKMTVKEMRGEARMYLEQATKLAASRGLAVEGIVLEGTATDEIIKAAVARQVTLIVIDARQRRVLERLLFGGSADQILRRSCLPVTVVRS